MSYILRCLPFVARSSSVVSLVSMNNPSCDLLPSIQGDPFDDHQSLVARVLAWVTAERPVTMSRFKPKPKNDTVKIGLPNSDKEMIKCNRAHDTQKSRTSIKREGDRQHETDEQ